MSVTWRQQYKNGQLTLAVALCVRRNHWDVTHADISSLGKFCGLLTRKLKTSGSAMAEGPREALVSRNPATTKHLT